MCEVVIPEPPQRSPSVTTTAIDPPHTTGVLRRRQKYGPGFLARGQATPSDFAAKAGIRCLPASAILLSTASCGIEPYCIMHIIRSAPIA